MNQHFKDLEEAIARENIREQERAADYEQLKSRVVKLEAQLKELKDASK